MVGGVAFPFLTVFLLPFFVQFGNLQRVGNNGKQKPLPGGAARRDQTQAAGNFGVPYAGRIGGRKHLGRQNAAQDLRIAKNDRPPRNRLAEEISRIHQRAKGNRLAEEHRLDLHRSCLACPTERRPAAAREQSADQREKGEQPGWATLAAEP